MRGPSHGEVRIAFGGDSVTQGCCSRDFGEIAQLTDLERLTDQEDGTHQGLQGFTYHLHELLRSHNSTIRYKILNYGIGAGSISSGHTYQQFKHNCRGEQLERSLPHLVVLGFGGID